MVYHTTNAGVVAAVDAQNGRIRWITRYPQSRSVLDNLSNPGSVWRNEPPLARGDKLYVTPVDSQLLLCLNKDTGRVLWVASRNADSTWPGREQTRFQTVSRMVGFSSEGLLCLVGADVVFLAPETGRLVWKVGMNDMWTDRGVVKERIPKGLEPSITGEGKDYWVQVTIVMDRMELQEDIRKLTKAEIQMRLDKIRQKHEQSKNKRNNQAQE